MSKKVVKQIEVLIFVFETNRIQVNVDVMFPNIYPQDKGFEFMMKELNHSKETVIRLCKSLKRILRTEANVKSYHDEMIKFQADEGGVFVCKTFFETFEDRDLLVKFLRSGAMKNKFVLCNQVTVCKFYDHHLNEIKQDEVLEQSDLQQ
jgi:hypothetical protein